MTNASTHHSGESDTIGLAASEQLKFIAVLGRTGAGKTTFINEASGSNLEVGENMQSCTGDIQHSKEFEVEPGSRVVLIDTPGFDDPKRGDYDVLKMIALYLEKTYRQGRAKLDGVVYLHKINDIRMLGSATRQATVFRKLCGHTPMRNVVIATTFWGDVNNSEHFGKLEGREEQLSRDENTGFGKHLSRGATLMRQDDGSSSALRIIRRIVGNHKPEALRIQKQMVDKDIAFARTDAAQALYEALNTQLQTVQKEMKDLKTEREGARRDGKASVIVEIEEEAARLRNRISGLEHEIKSVRTVLSWLRIKLKRWRGDPGAQTAT